MSTQHRALPYGGQGMEGSRNATIEHSLAATIPLHPENHVARLPHAAKTPPANGLPPRRPWVVAAGDRRVRRLVDGGDCGGRRAGLERRSLLARGLRPGRAVLHRLGLGRSGRSNASPSGVTRVAASRAGHAAPRLEPPGSGRLVLRPEQPEAEPVDRRPARSTRCCSSSWSR